jgi:hypothetical protein|tara:strand:- start:298 stop:462 length:165 start_codon:yes stop_codon:yes gene_type:complete
MREFEAHFKGDKIIVQANSLWGAKQEAIKLLGISKKQEGLLAIQLKDSLDFVYN